MIRVCSAAAHTPCARNIFVYRHTITIDLPFCRQSYSVRHRKCIAFALRNQYVSTIPPDKGISGVRLRRCRNGRAEIVLSVSADTARFGNVFVDYHTITVGLPFCRQSYSVRHRKCIAFALRNQYVSTIPPDKGISGVRLRRCRNGRAEIVLSVSADTARFGNVFVYRHTITVDFPFCRQNPIRNNDERIIGFFRKQCFSVKPTEERISGVCRCRQSYL